MRKILIIVISVFLLTSCGNYDVNTEEGRKAFLASYGWEVSGDSIEQVDITIPKVLDKVYEGYNNIQKEAGMDLIPYLGKKAVRYTYIVTNHSLSDDGGVRANLLVCEGKVIAGDIMNPSLYGFMLPLNSKPDSFMQ